MAEKKKTKTRMGPKTVSRTRADAYAAFARNDGSSSATIGAELGVSAQRIRKLHVEYRKAVGIEQQQVPDEAIAETQFAAGDVASPQPATPSTATDIERQRLRELVGDDVQLEVLVDKILRGSAPRAASLAVGMSGKVFSTRMERDPKFRNLVMRAAHEAESSVAQNLYRLATGNSPQAAQSAIAWLNARVPDDWSPGHQKIEIEVNGGIDVAHILMSPRLIELANELEAARQQAEAGLELPAPQGEIIEGEVIDLDVREARSAPPLPEDEITSVPIPVEIEVAPPRMNRPGQQGQQGVSGPRPMRHQKVDGIETEFSDEIGPSSASEGIRVL